MNDPARPLRNKWLMFLLWAIGTYVPAFWVFLWFVPPQHIGTSIIWHAAFFLPSTAVGAIGTLVMHEGCEGGFRGAMAGSTTGLAISLVSTSIACAGMTPHGEPAAWYAIALTPVVFFASAVGGILGAACNFRQDA